MKAYQILPLAFLLIITTAFHCKKDVNPCEGLVAPKADFAFKEVLTDTAFFADTVFGDNPVMFTASRPYKSVLWKVGDDPREFTNSSFSLIFYPFLGSLDVRFTGRNDANPFCFPGDSGVYRGSKQLTIVEQVDRATLTVSPLVGRYRGAFNTNPNDSFTVRIDYFDSAKYVSILGMRNFYWVSNIPRGFITSTNAGIFPELKNGMNPEMGYKCFSFGDAGDIVTGKGFGEFNNGILKIYYQHQQTGRKIFIGSRIQ
jgi:hypothetical protein